MYGASEVDGEREAGYRSPSAPTPHVPRAAARPRRPLVGRETERALLTSLVTSTEHPLITVAGEPGTGKTTLIRSAIDTLDTARIAVSRADATQWPALPPLANIRHHLSRVRRPPQGYALVVIQNADRLLPWCGDIATLARDEGSVVIVLETARESSGADAGPVVRLGPLGHDDAAALFRAAAAASGVEYGYDGRTNALIGQVCNAVDRNALGIELAAARVRLMSLEELASTLDSPRGAIAVLSQLAGRRRYVRAVDRADNGAHPPADSAEHLLDLLSVFTGSFSLQAVEAVAGEHTAHMFDSLTELIDARLVQVEDENGDRRFRLSRLVRAAAAARLAASGAESAARHRHAAYFASRARQAARAADNAREDDAHAILGADIPDAWDALTLLTEANPAAALRLAADLAWDAQGRGTAIVLAEIIERLLTDVSTDDLSIRRDALLWLAQLQSWSPGATDRADVIRARLEEALSLARAVNEPLAILRALRVRFLAVTTDGDLAGAVAACTEGIALATAIGHVRWLSRFEISLSSMHAFTEQWDTAMTLAMSALSRAMRAEDKRAIVLAGLVVHAAPAGVMGDTATLPSLESLLAIANEVGDATSESHALATLAYRAIEAGDHQDAARWVAARHERLGRAELLHGLTVSTMLTVLIAHLRGDLATAARLHAAIAPAMESLLTVLPSRHVERYSAALADVRDQLGPAAFDAESTAGRLLGREQILTEVASYLVAARPVPPLAQDAPMDAPTDAASLTPREQQVLRALARGLRNKEIASELRITPKTVMHHTVAIYRKLGVRGRAEAATHPIAQRLAASTVPRP